jgi:ring-1,2-phenylacetyl-CoA epoxidase subunit PaaD
MVTTTNPYTSQDIFEFLWAVADPEIPVVNIQEMGMLRGVNISDNGVEVIITPSYTACPAMKFIELQIIETLHQKGIPNVKVTTTYSPAWSTDWLSESTKQKLKDYGIAAPVESLCRNPFYPEKVEVECPRCQSLDTKLVSQYGSTPCKALYKCNSCLEPFDYFKCHS